MRARAPHETRRTALPRDEDAPPERCILAGMDLRPRWAGGRVPLDSLTAEESLAELAELAAGAGAEVLGHALQVREKAVPATLLGKGKLQEIRAWAAMEGCDFVLFDHSLSASQHRNLERELDCPVLDRTQLILDIFAKHARSKEGRLHVELAQLEYLLPRLAGRGASMSRLGGGIGTRGPGETQLESDRRKIQRRITKLRSQLQKVRSTRQLQRAKRVSVPVPTLALCGYTNAGKSTLFNALTRASVLADERMFATLDPTLRRLRLPSKRPAILSDTVGFIRDLPPTLIQAFRATLEEVTEAALVIHVLDVSADNRAMHREEVDRVLAELGARDKPQILVLNKCDLLRGDTWSREVARQPRTGSVSACVGVSAKTGAGLDRLLETIDRVLAIGAVIRKRYRLPYSEGRTAALLYEQARILARIDSEDGIEMEVELTPALAGRLERFAVPIGQPRKGEVAFSDTRADAAGARA